MEPVLGFGASEFHSPAASGVLRQVFRAEQLSAGQGTRHLAGRDALHRLPDHASSSRFSPTSKAREAPDSATRWGSPASPTWTWSAIRLWAKTPYVSRVMLHYTIPLSKETTEATRNPLSLASTVPVRRLELRARQDEHGRFLRPELGRQRQPSAVHELGDREQRRLRLRRRHARLHVWPGGGVLRRDPGRRDLARC